MPTLTRQDMQNAGAACKTADSLLANLEELASSETDVVRMVARDLIAKTADIQSRISALEKNQG